MNNTLNLKLEDAIRKFLYEKFVLRKLEIHSFFERNIPPIFWVPKSHYSLAVDSTDACTLLDDCVFQDWQVFNKDTITFFVKEFELWNFLKNGPKFKKREAKQTIKSLVEETDLVLTIKFNPMLKSLISEGRHKVSGVIPLNSTDARRIKINAKVGEAYYLCKDYQKPFIANPCYIVKNSTNGSFRVMFFTNAASQFLETKKTVINAYGFTTVFANELGTTPEQSVRQRQG